MEKEYSAAPPSNGGRAEIVGAGFAGLVAALTLARRGWSVRVHERSPVLRSEGFSINFYENGLKVFEALGVDQDILKMGHEVKGRETRDREQILVKADTNPRMVRVPREHVIRVLAAGLEAAGGSIDFSSQGVSATPEGLLTLADGSVRESDLVVAADSVNSKVRDSLDLLKRRHLLNEGGLRMLVPRQPGSKWDKDDIGLELWSGRRRLMIRPTGPDEHYVTLTCPADDGRARQTPVDPSVWSTSFPQYRDFFEYLAVAGSKTGVHWAQFQVVRLHAWSRGRVAVVGDAAHAMPPNLGQGGGCAIVNAFALGNSLSGSANVKADLRRWEQLARPLTAHTQFWSWAYGLPLRCPDPLRTSLLSMISRSHWLKGQMERAARHEPRGWAVARFGALEHDTTQAGSSA